MLYLGIKRVQCCSIIPALLLCHLLYTCFIEKINIVKMEFPLLEVYLFVGIDIIMPVYSVVLIQFILFLVMFC